MLGIVSSVLNEGGAYLGRRLIAICTLRGAWLVPGVAVNLDLMDATL